MTSKVAIIRSNAENALSDVARVMELGGYRDSLAPDATTILKDNISGTCRISRRTPRPGSSRA